MKKLILCLFAAVFALSTQSFAVENAAKQKKSILPLSFEDFNRLSQQQKEKYIKALQDFMVRGDFGNDPQLKTSLMDLFVQRSFATAAGDTCIFAGNFSKVISYKGRLLCKKTAQGPCEKGKVQCNPFLFGRTKSSSHPDQGICVGEPFEGATASCQREAPLIDILKVIGSENDHKHFVEHVIKIKEYCKKPLALNINNCDQLKLQIDEVSDRYSAVNLKPTTTASPAAAK